VVSADTPCAAVAEMFKANPELASLVVTHPDGGLEMLTRERFASEFIGRLGYGRALYARRPVGHLPGSGRWLILNASTTLLDSGHAAIARRGAERYDDLVVSNAEAVSTVSVANLFTELAALHAHRSQHDALTGLANRDRFDERLRDALAGGRAGAAVLFVDIDDFKSINDSLGHTAGDELLELLAERLRDAFREDDSVARFGGDEFAVLLTGADERAAILAAERIALALAAPALVGGRSVGVRASVGIALESPGRTPESLLRDADLAMYVSKRNAAGGHRVFAAAMHSEAIERLELVHESRPRAGRGPAAAGVPADHEPRERESDRRGGAAALDASSARSGRSPPVHRARGAVRRDRGHRAMGARRGTPPGHGVAASPARLRSPDRRRQRLPAPARGSGTSGSPTSCRLRTGPV